MGTTGKDKFVGTPNDDTYHGLADNDRIFGLAGNDTLYGDAGHDIIFAGAGNDKVFGGTGHDFLSGGIGDDTLKGGKGRDVMMQNTGNDHFDGGEDFDMLLADLKHFADNAFTVLLDFTTGKITNSLGAAHDTFVNVEAFWFQSNTKIDVAVEGDSNANFVRTGAGKDLLNGYGGNDLLHGGWGNDEINGGLGNDRLRGHRGNDTIDGGVGRDRIDGHFGKDVITGGAGDDHLRGGSGSDIFDFGDVAASGRDRIYDFKDDVDTIRLTAANLWTGPRTAQDVLDDFGSLKNGVAKLNFGDGDVLFIKGVSALRDLVDDISII